LLNCLRCFARLLGFGLFLELWVCGLCASLAWGLGIRPSQRAMAYNVRPDSPSIDTADIPLDLPVLCDFI
jgi:hypothetical protein